ncbi:MAG: YceI family protein, partial [Planctomycetes bacterium]|nr:YceI family protein [Planctomycetota bacterium]
FVLGLLGGSIAGFAVLKDRIKVVIAADEVAAGPDPVALLRDDVGSLARDLGALQSALAGNFEKLAQGLDEAAAARADATQRSLAELQQRVAALAAAQQELPARLLALEHRVAALREAPPTAMAAAPSGVTPTVATPLQPTPEAEPVVKPPDPVVPAGPESAQPMAVAKPRKSFGFDVPTSKFKFDEAQDFVLVPELSRVGFDAKSTLHDFSGVTSKLRGSFHAALGRAQGDWTGLVEVEAATLLTGVDGRDSNLREHLAVKDHPLIAFAVLGFTPDGNGIDAERRKVTGTVRGTMTIRGQGKEVAMPVTLEVDPQQRVVLTGQMPLKLSDYGVPVPSQLGVINMQDEVKVWIALRARVKAGGGK